MNQVILVLILLGSRIFIVYIFMALSLAVPVNPAQIGISNLKPYMQSIQTLGYGIIILLGFFFSSELL